MTKVPQITNLDPNKTIIDLIISDKVARKEITKNSHLWFFHLYFNQYVKYATADFQKELFSISEDDNITTAVIVAFRGSAKSTIMTMSYPLWAVLGRLQKKCIVILSQTQQQAKMHFANIKRELESNELLRSDLGPFKEDSDEWGSLSLVIPKFNAKIIAASSEQSIRGLRHGANRPDLIICDDVEDLASTKTRDSREKTFNWFMGEIRPIGSKNTKMIAIGNLLHEDSLLMRLKAKIEAKEIDAVYREYPIMDEEYNPLWPGMFEDLDEIHKYKKTVGDEKSWQREYMLKILPDDDQIIKPEWIQYYDSLPDEVGNDYKFTACGVDLAISEKDTADYTAMVLGKVYGHKTSLKIYILPNIVNRKMNFNDTINLMKDISDQYFRHKYRSMFYVEDIGFQRSYIQVLSTQNVKAKGVSPNRSDKRSRLSIISHLIANGQVLFPRRGAEQLIDQLINFGVEKHDDLCDAFVYLVDQTVLDVRPTMKMM